MRASPDGVLVALRKLLRHPVVNRMYQDAVEAELANLETALAQALDAAPQPQREKAGDLLNLDATHTARMIRAFAHQQYQRGEMIEHAWRNWGMLADNLEQVAAAGVGRVPPQPEKEK